MAGTTPFHPSQLKYDSVFIRAMGAGHGGVGSGVLITLATLGFKKNITATLPDRRKVSIKPDYPLIVTCAHCVNGRHHITVETAKHEMVQAATIAIDNEADVALLVPFQVDGLDSFKNAATPGDSNLVLQGDKVWAVGAPLGEAFSFSLNSGHISYRARPAPTDASGRMMTYLRGFQISARIQPGNSGGPLFSKDGKWIGMNYAGLMDGDGSSERGINFSLHVNDVLLILRRTLETGKVIRPGLSMSARKIHAPDIAALDLDDDRGVLVNYVRKGSEAAKHFRPMDVILQINGDKVKNMSDFRYAIYKAAGKRQPVNIRLLRGGKEVAFPLLVPTVEMPFSHLAEFDYLGLDVQESYIDKGLTIAAVAPNSPAAQVGLRRNMVITAMEKPGAVGKLTPLTDLLTFYTLITDHLNAGKTAFYVEVQGERVHRKTLVPIVIPPQLVGQILAGLSNMLAGSGPGGTPPPGGGTP